VHTAIVGPPVGRPTRVAFTFPGQGSQFSGMGRAWTDDDAWELVERAAAVAGRDIAHLLLDADDEELRLTRNAQLAVFVLGLVVDRAVRQRGFLPAFCAGHSLGEYTALAAVGAVPFEDAVCLVVERSEAMQAADEQNPGTMTTVLDLDFEDANAACARADGDVWVANYNAPRHTVVAGAPSAVAAAEQAAAALGAGRVVPLPVGGAYHTRYMAPARARLRAALAATRFTAPGTPVVANVDGRLHADLDDWPALLSAQLSSPVRWWQSIRRLESFGTDVFLELGPGPGFSTLIQRTTPQALVLHVRTPADLEMGPAGVVSGHRELDTIGELGERLHVAERLVVSPFTGVYRSIPTPRITTEDDILAEGDVVGTVGSEPVRSPFRGWLMGTLAIEGERVRKGQPIAWLRLA
jgi:[acyl-carrier-protein] S-malonyltransferase